MAVLVTVPGVALRATRTIRVMGGQLLPAARTLLRVQVTVDRLQLHPEPVILPAVSPAGRVS
ncbi:hypothetical protein OG741_21195 [Streptomyces sp. NBC_01410]